jgi:exonuclease SbcC
MRYGTEQCADFDGASLISICGENGAGKSAIFDAILFALYREHRLGAQNTDQLITQDRARFSVEFEFEADGTLYRVRRSGGVAAKEREMGMWHWDEPSREWIELPGTHQLQALERAIAAIVRVPKEAFTASFLLQQNDALKFIDAKPAERFGIVKSLIGLGEYEALEKAARVERLAAGKQRDGYEETLRGFDGVTPEIIDQKRAELGAATLREQEALKSRELAEHVMRDAVNYDRLSNEVIGLEAKETSLRAILDRRGEIEAAAQQFETLDETLRVLADIQASLVAHREAADAADRLTSEAGAINVEELEATVAKAESELGARRDARAGAERDTTAAQAHREETRRFRDLATRILERRGQIARLDAQIAEARSNLERQPEVAERLHRAQSVLDALPDLQSLHDRRDSRDRLRLEQPAQRLAEAEQRVELLKVQHGEAMDRGEKLRAAEVEAHNAFQKADAEFMLIREQVVHREEASKEAVCSRCGQPIDPKEAAAQLKEIQKRAAVCEKARTEAERARGQATAEREKADAVADALRAEVRQQEQRAAALKPRVDALAQAEADDAVAFGAFLETATAAMKREVGPDTGVDVIADLLRRSRAARELVRTIGQELNELIELQGTMTTAARSRDEVVTLLKADEHEAGARLGDIPAAASEDEAAALALQSARDAEAAARDAVDIAQKTIDLARLEATDAAGRRQRLANEAALASQRAEHASSQMRVLAERLPSAAREAALADPAREVARVTADRAQLAAAPAELHELRNAEQQHAGTMSLLEARRAEAEGIPAEHRLPIADAETILKDAQDGEQSARLERQSVFQELTQAESRLDEANRVRFQRNASQKRYRQMNRIAELLGKGGLQGLLVTESLNAITSNANGFLEKLTGGSLRLELKREQKRAGADDEIELLALDATSMREARPVKVLSGSQKFRVAVALASGIGQHAGAGGMRSIIIDEGFASLDLGSQRQMVQELKDLAQHMDRVIVVSHIEAFDDPQDFPTRIYVEKRGDVSVIRRTG